MKLLAGIGLAVGVMFTSPCLAQSRDPLIEGAKLCTRHLPRYERQYGIPTHLLSAIASTESGRYHDGLKINIPWPWTINAEGKGYYFDTKEQAIAAARKLRARGVTSMDVGCMQVNLYHHGHAFTTLEQAFEPEQNVAYAASFLRTLYQDSSSWKKAASDYHSKTPTRGTQYAGLVYNSWFKIVDKLRAARIQTASVTQQAPGELAPSAKAPVQVAIRDYVEVTPTVAPTDSAKDTAYIKHVKPLPEQRGQKVAAYQPVRMNSISVSTRSNDGIIVVKPDIKVVSDTQPQAIRVAQVRSNEVSVSNVATSSTSGSSRKAGPNFIFND